MFQKKIEQYKSEGCILSYIDESGFAVDMPRTHGYGKVGDRCYVTHNWSVRGRENVIGALANNSLTACGIVNSYVDSNTFNTWLEKILVPELPENTVIIMDNPVFHKGHRTKEILNEHGHELEFLPPYSPDLNLIEHKWAQAKSLRRKQNCSTLEIFQKYLL